MKKNNEKVSFLDYLTEFFLNFDIKCKGFTNIFSFYQNMYIFDHFFKYQNIPVVLKPITNYERKTFSKDKPKTAFNCHSYWHSLVEEANPFTISTKKQIN